MRLHTTTPTVLAAALLAWLLAAPAPAGAMTVIEPPQTTAELPANMRRADQAAPDDGWSQASPDAGQKGIVSTPDRTVIVRPKQDNTEQDSR